MFKITMHKATFLWEKIMETFRIHKIWKSHLRKTPKIYVFCFLPQRQDETGALKPPLLPPDLAVCQITSPPPNPALTLFPLESNELGTKSGKCFSNHNKACCLSALWVQTRALPWCKVACKKLSHANKETNTTGEGVKISISVHHWLIQCQYKKQVFQQQAVEECIWPTPTRIQVNSDWWPYCTNPNRQFRAHQPKCSPLRSPMTLWAWMAKSFSRTVQNRINSQAWFY